MDGIHGGGVNAGAQRAVPVIAVGKGNAEVGEQRPLHLNAHLRRNVGPLRNIGQRDLLPQAGRAGTGKRLVLDGLHPGGVFVPLQAGVDRVFAFELLGEDRPGHAAGGVKGGGEKAVPLHHIHQQPITGNIGLEHCPAQCAGNLGVVGQLVQKRRQLLCQIVRPRRAGQADLQLHRDQPGELPRHAGCDMQAVQVVFGRAPGAARLVHLGPQGKGVFHLAGKDNVICAGGIAEQRADLGAQPAQELLEHLHFLQSAQRYSRASTV